MNWFCEFQFHVDEPCFHDSQHSGDRKIFLCVHGGTGLCRLIKVSYPFGLYEFGAPDNPHYQFSTQMSTYCFCFFLNLMQGLNYLTILFSSRVSRSAHRIIHLSDQVHWLWCTTRMFPLVIRTVSVSFKLHICFMGLHIFRWTFVSMYRKTIPYFHHSKVHCLCGSSSMCIKTSALQF